MERGTSHEKKWLERCLHLHSWGLLIEGEGEGGRPLAAVDGGGRGVLSSA